jgi:hypothetical protein
MALKASGGLGRAKPARKSCQVFSANGPTLLLELINHIDMTIQDKHESIKAEDNQYIVLYHYSQG